jgi:hypothetical protein
MFQDVLGAGDSSLVQGMTDGLYSFSEKEIDGP